MPATCERVDPHNGIVIAAQSRLSIEQGIGVRIGNQMSDAGPAQSFPTPIGSLVLPPDGSVYLLPIVTGNGFMTCVVEFSDRCDEVLDEGIGATLLEKWSEGLPC